MKKTKAKPKKLNFWQRFITLSQKYPGRTTITVLLAAILIYFGLSGIQYYSQVYREKAQLKSTEITLDKLYKSLGKASEAKDERYCSYTSAKFSKGFLSCSLSRQYLYRINDNKNVTSKLVMERQINVLKSLPNIKKLKYVTTPTDYEGYQLVDARNFSINGIQSCTWYAYLIKTKLPEYFPSWSRIVQGDVVLELYCSESALEEYYPVKDR